MKKREGLRQQKGPPRVRVAHGFNRDTGELLLRGVDRTQVRQVAQRFRRCELFSLLDGLLGHANASQRIGYSHSVPSPLDARKAPKRECDRRSGEIENKRVNPG